MNTASNPPATAQGMETFHRRVTAEAASRPASIATDCEDGSRRIGERGQEDRDDHSGGGHERRRRTRASVGDMMVAPASASNPDNDERHRSHDDEQRGKAHPHRIHRTTRALAHAVADDRLTRNVAQTAIVAKGRERREGEALSFTELHALVSACREPHGDLVLVLAHTGLRWGELAGLQFGDRVALPAAGLRVQRAVLASSGSGELFVDSLENYRSRTIPLMMRAAEIVATWAGERGAHDWHFPSPSGSAHRGRNWKRVIGWSAAEQAIGRPTLSVPDLRHPAASIWRASGADPEVVQRILGHANATMTMDLYGHLIDTNLWETARRVRGHSGDTAEERGGA